MIFVDDNLEVNGEESVSDIIRSQTKEENILYQSTQSIRDFQSYPMKEAQYSEPKEYLYSTNSSSLKEPTSSFVLPVPEQPSEDQLITQYLTKHSLSLPSSKKPFLVESNHLCLNTFPSLFTCFELICPGRSHLHLLIS